MTCAGAVASEFESPLTTGWARTIISCAEGWVLERKLTAILCADVFGYSRLMGEDEEATHRTLTSHRKVIDGLIEQHHGRFVNSAGDSVLAEFAVSSTRSNAPSRSRPH